MDGTDSRMDGSLTGLQVSHVILEIKQMMDFVHHKMGFLMIICDTHCDTLYMRALQPTETPCVTIPPAMPAAEA